MGNKDSVVIVGASHAGVHLAAKLRDLDWQGNITLVGEEPYLPYERPPLSKDYLLDKKSQQQIQLRNETFFRERNIHLCLGSPVEKIDRENKQVTLGAGHQIGYDKLAICTGASPIRLKLPGSDLKGICYIRTIADMNHIKPVVKPGKNAVIVGGGYIGLEAAAALRQLGMNVTVIEQLDRVLARVTAPVLSDFYTRVHSEEGVVIETGRSVCGFEGGHKVEAVLTDDGGKFPADLVIIGIGVRPNVALAQEAGMDVDNGICVDAFCKTADPNIFAAGDCVSFPYAPLNKRIRLESVPSALEQAVCVASGIAGAEYAYSLLPWFWSDQYDVKLQIAGINTGYDRILIRGSSIEGRSFSAWYFEGEKLLAVDCIHRPKDFMAAKMILKNGEVPGDDAIQDESFDLVAFAKGASAKGAS